MTQGKAGAAAAREDGALPVYADPTRAGELRSMMTMAKPNVVVNLLPQIPNTLFHDGKKWKGYEQLLREGAAALIEAAKATNVGHIVHTSYALLYGDTEAPVDESAVVSAPGGHAIFSAALDAEKMILDSGIPACVLRAGFLYGPQSHDLLLYQRSFKLGRPFYAGAGKATSWVHYNDMASAVVLAAEKQAGNEVFNIADNTPVSLGSFIDEYAHKLDMGKPGRLPTAAARLFMADEQITLLDLSTLVKTSKAQEKLEWKPRYSSYREGLEQTLLVARATEKIL
jgi:nucleoside-diphosphate-sugar epimerase